jgi:hypothetical protein
MVLSDCGELALLLLREIPGPGEIRGDKWARWTTYVSSGERQHARLVKRRPRKRIVDISPVNLEHALSHVRLPLSEVL